MGGGGVARRRASVKVEFSVKVANEAAANAGVTKLNTFLTTGTQFKDALKAKGGALANVTGTKVTKAPVAKKTTQLSAVWRRPLPCHSSAWWLWHSHFFVSSQKRSGTRTGCGTTSSAWGTATHPIKCL